jgi:hypothetical protein
MHSRVRPGTVSKRMLARLPERCQQEEEHCPMRISFRTCGAVIVAGFALLELSPGSVHAQGGPSACVQACRSGGWSYNQCTRYCETTIAADSKAAAPAPGAPPPAARPPGARVYGYQARQSGSCGQYRYLKGGQCVDARNDPPNLRCLLSTEDEYALTAVRRMSERQVRASSLYHPTPRSRHRQTRSRCRARCFSPSGRTQQSGKLRPR